nr:immunoglobulin light chain junction region [Macaca mulatta]MOW57006.1 immunoglobulin light chain junction region [Macaca mulatta]MOW58909.1 immunoglobulin light chain junction region [Macaca mulatta]MOW59767.1 immunoglobulin light chain junction region [Macaca mulatta]MOW60895.1 immunoglobulin light chain junction region [Macaca mulatta]
DYYCSSYRSGSTWVF